MRALSPIELQEGMTTCRYFCEHLIKATMLNEYSENCMHTKVSLSISRAVFSFNWEHIHHTNASLWKCI